MSVRWEQERLPGLVYASPLRTALHLQIYSLARRTQWFRMTRGLGEGWMIPNDHDYDPGDFFFFMQERSQTSLLRQAK